MLNVYMDEFLKMDIFFFIASICGGILTILLAIALIYLIALIRDLKHISNTAKTEADNLSQDINDLRQNVKKKGFQLTHAINFFSTIIKRIRKEK
jgi:hypothetical protein